MHEKSSINTMIAGLTVGQIRSAAHQGMARLTPLHRELVQAMPMSAEQEIRVLFATLQPGDVTPHHTHRHPVTVYVLGGVFTLALEGRELVAIKAGDVFVEPASVSMTGYNEGNEPAEMVLFYVCQADEPFADPATKL